MEPFHHYSLSKMSDLAPFVAATIRDRVVTELQAENDRLTRALQAAMTVQVMGQGGSPIYASADFSSGRPEQGSSAFWNVRFDDTDDNDESSSSSSSSNSIPLPLSRLGELEVVVGGILLAEMSQDYVEGFSSLDSLTGAVRYLELEVRKCWITLEIVEGTLPDAALELLRDSSPGMLWRILSTHIASTYPQAQLRVQEVSLDTKYVPGLLQRVPRDPFAEEAERRLEEAQRLLRAIVARLRRHDPSVRGSNTLLARGRQIQAALLAREGIRTEADPRFEATMDRLLQEQVFLPVVLQQRQGSNPNLFAVSR